MRHPAEAYCPRCGSPIKFDDPESRRGICTFVDCQKVFSYIVRGPSESWTVLEVRPSRNSMVNALEEIDDGSMAANAVMDYMEDELGVRPVSMIAERQGIPVVTDGRSETRMTDTEYRRVQARLDEQSTDDR